MGYVLLIAISVGVGVGVYRLTGNLPVVEQGPEPWMGAAPAEQAAPAPPTNFERLSISHDRLSWHDRIIGSLGLVVAVAVGAAALAFALYLAGSTLIGILEKAANSPT